LNNRSNEHPGPQVAKTGFSNKFSILHLLLLLSGILLLQTLTAENNAILSIPALNVFGINIWSLKLLDSSAAISLLIGILSLIYVRGQFAVGLRPILNYKCFRSLQPESDLAANLSDSGYWVATLENAGPGTAIVLDAEYRVVLKEGEDTDYTSYTNAINILENIGVRYGTDFTLVYLSGGWCLPSGRECKILEISVSNVLNIYAVAVVSQRLFKKNQLVSR